MNTLQLKEDFQVTHGARQPHQLFASEPELIPLPQASALVHVSGKTLRRLIRERRFPGCRIGRNYFIPKPALIEFVNGRWQHEQC